ncbi:hypothetical protein GCM10011384_07730 [Psychrobacillus lasiicapitis]|nr:hypothetical protein GCM10011384_07730 [Psychrobacillus lasiicapitis]
MLEHSSLYGNLEFLIYNYSANIISTESIFIYSRIKVLYCYTVKRSGATFFLILIAIM